MNSYKKALCKVYAVAIINPKAYHKGGVAFCMKRSEERSLIIRPDLFQSGRSRNGKRLGIHGISLR